MRGHTHTLSSILSLARGLWENQFSFPCFTGSLGKQGFPTPFHRRILEVSRVMKKAVSHLNLFPRPNIFRLHKDGQ